MADRPLASLGVAVFVKTPGHSPIKTRLAAGIGDPAAAECYEHALAVVREVVTAASGRVPAVVPYWAVAERAGESDPRWAGFARLPQGEGTLGERLDRVYRAVRARHGAALLLGADCPLLSPDDLAAAVGTLARGEAFVIGRATDGGYYLFGGRRAIDRGTWLAVPYSSPETADRFVALLGRPVAELPVLPDMDTAADLSALARHPRTREGGLLPAQRSLLGWLADRGID